MVDIAAAVGRSDGGKPGRTSGWYVLLLGWLVFAGAFYAFSKGLDTTASDITNYELLEIADKYANYVGVALGLVAYLATGVVYLILRLFRLKNLRVVALALTAAGYSAWLALGYDLVYREPRYTQIANVIITYTGKPMLYSAALVCGAALVGLALTLVFKNRSK